MILSFLFHFEYYDVLSENFDFIINLDFNKSTFPNLEHFKQIRLLQE
jgi:hypothetical protein